MNKNKPMLLEPAIFDDIIEAELVAKNLPNFVGHVTELDLTSQCFVEYGSNVNHINTFKVRMPLGRCYKIKPIHALPDETNNTS